MDNEHPGSTNSGSGAVTSAPADIAEEKTALVSNDLTLDTFCINLDLCECRDDDGLSNTAERCGSGAADAGKVVAVAPSDPLDDAEVAEPAMLTRGLCSACSKALSTGSKKLIPLTVFCWTVRGLVSRSRARTPAEKSSSAERCAR